MNSHLNRGTALWRIALILTLVMVITVGGCAQPTPAPTAAPVSAPTKAPEVKADYEFFNGKVVTFIVATKPGGGYDAFARLVQPYLQKNLPGSTVIVKNVPGAGHIIGTNEIMGAKPDGLTIATFNTAMISAQIVGSEGIQFDLTKLTWITKMSSDNRVVMVGAKTPYKTIDDLVKATKPVLFSSAGVASASHTDMMILQEALGLNVKLIAGYAGSEGELAILRGEVDGAAGTWGSLKKFVDNGDGRILLQVGLKKDPGLANVPLATEIVKPEKKALVDLITSLASLGRLVAAPPNLPPARRLALIEAFQKTLTDPDFLDKAKKADMLIDPAYGDDVAKMVTSSLSQTPENLAKLKVILEPSTKGE